MKRQQLDTDQKALEINLDNSIYGTFAEIGAGQEVARYFFKVGAAAGTVAKTMSAYDKVYSDRIYGRENSGRYVCESRVLKMLDHEYDLMHERLQEEKKETRFFVFADTIAAINYQKTIKGNGWLGLRFQLDPNAKPNDLVVHVNMLDHDNQLQQSAIGTLGVNMIHAVYYHSHNPEEMLRSFVDNLGGRVSIDLIRLTGPDYREFDNRLLSLFLVRQGLCAATIFGPDKLPVHASEFLYGKHLILIRRSYRPLSIMDERMCSVGQKQFLKDCDIEPSSLVQLADLNINELFGVDGLDENDFLDRTEVLCAMGKTVVISNSNDYQSLITYLSNFKLKKIGLVMDAHELEAIILDKYEHNAEGALLASFGELFKRNMRVYVYPSQMEGSDKLQTAADMQVPMGMKFLYKHLLSSHQIIDALAEIPELIPASRMKLFDKVRERDAGWENYFSPEVVDLINDNNLFSHP